MGEGRKWGGTAWGSSSERDSGVGAAGVSSSTRNAELRDWRDSPDPEPGAGAEGHRPLPAHPLLSLPFLKPSKPLMAWGPSPTPAMGTKAPALWRWVSGILQPRRPTRRKRRNRTFLKAFSQVTRLSSVLASRLLREHSSSSVGRLCPKQ